MDKYQKVAVHGMIKREDGKFLVLHRSKVNDFLPGLYDFPGGSVEFGEKPLVALKREINEETSLNIEIIRPIYVCSEVQKEIRHQIWIIYECRYLGGEIKLNPEEHDEYKWVDFEEASNLPKIVFLKSYLKSLVK